MKKIYLDNGMVTRPSSRSVSRMLPFLSDRWGIPSAPHTFGQEVLPAAKDAFEKIYTLFDADSADTVIFTSSGAEAINHLFLATYLDITLPTGKNQFLVGSADEAPALMASSRLEALGCVSKWVGVDGSGLVTVDAIADQLTPRTALVSLSWGNGMTGVLQPIEEIATLCQERGVLLHLEGSHVLGKIFFERENVGATFITLSGEKIHAPQGTGALYIKKGGPHSPFIMGGLEQGGRRAGSLNTASLVALGEAASEALESREYLCTEGARLRNLLEARVIEGFPEAMVLFRETRRLPHCTTIAFRGVLNEALLFTLNQKGVFACIGGGSFQQLSLNVESAGVSKLVAQTALSFSLSRYTTEEEIEEAAKVIVEMAHSLRKGSREILPEEILI